MTDWSVDVGGRGLGDKVIEAREIDADPWIQIESMETSLPVRAERAMRALGTA